MKSITVIILALASLTAARAGQPAQPDIEPTLTIFADAFRSGDFETVEAHIAEDYVHVNSGGAPYDRAQWLGWYKGYAAEIASGDHVFDEYIVQSLQITRHHDAAYVTGVVRANGTRYGEAFAQNIRFTNLWIIEDGRWKRAGFHDAESSD